jgi:hypothetical protein
MNRIIPLVLVLLVFNSCKNESKKDIIQPEKELTIAEKIANAHGFQQWNNVTSFEFTFGGKIEDQNSGRSWIWNPKTNDIKLVSNGETTEYNRNAMDSVALKADRAFINDKFWALIPFQLVWDKGLTISEPVSANSPVKQEALFKITITYSNEGGYTPGDAYDIYYDTHFMIREWTYRKGNASEPTLSNSFENYQDFNGLKIALEHKKSEGDWNLLIRNIKVELE